MGWFSTMLQASIAAYTAARRVFEDPASSHNQMLYLNQQAMYNLLWSYYNGAMFEKIVGAANAWNWAAFAGGWQAYKMNYNLYRNIRLIYNPTRRLVDFYAGQVYPGVLSEDGQKLPDGVPLAVPFSDDTPKALKSAVAQFWQWSNWQARKAVQVRYGAALGDVLIEVVDDVEHGTVSADIVWPGFVVDLETDMAGNVKKYALRYQAQDETGGYMYGKIVDRDSFRYFRNDEPYDYTGGKTDGPGSVVENPYGFVPAIWIKHIDVGGRHGSPAIAGSFGKIDELNNLASHVHDQIHKVIGAPALIASSGSITNISNTQKRVPTAEFVEPATDQESILMLKGPADSKVMSLAGNLNLAEALAAMKELTGEIENDHPELVFYKELRAMSQVTGPAAQRLVGDVASRFAEAAAIYDNANTKLFQMAIAIAGFRANSGAWGSLNRQQQKFTPFNLDSYDRGDLDMAIMPRPLLVPTRQEIGLENELMWKGVWYAAQSGVPAEFVLAEAGWTEDKIQQIVTAKALARITSDQPAPALPAQATPGEAPVPGGANGAKAGMM